MSLEMLGLYVHIPFCSRKCRYCDFVSGPFDSAQRRHYLRSLQREMANSPWSGWPVRSVFFGGGTPSELDGPEIRSLVESLRAHFDLDRVQECTLECNPDPGTLEEAKLETLRQLGFNRVSLGVQSFQDRHLRSLGRLHSGRDAIDSFRRLRRAGFDNINLDLLYALPDQDLSSWRFDLERAVSLKPEHLSLYSLTVEPGTEFGHRAAQGELPVVSEDLAADMFELAMDFTASNGYLHYELCSYSRPGRECRHQLIYWRNQAFLGFGLGAASFAGGIRWKNTTDLQAYLAGASSGMIPRASEEVVSSRQALADAVVLGLQTAEGVDLASLSEEFCLDAISCYRQTAASLAKLELVVQEGSRLRLTRQGKLLADRVCAEFLDSARLSQKAVPS